MTLNKSAELADLARSEIFKMLNELRSLDGLETLGDVSKPSNHKDAVVVHLRYLMYFETVLRILFNYVATLNAVNVQLQEQIENTANVGEV